MGALRLRFLALAACSWALLALVPGAVDAAGGYTLMLSSSADRSSPVALGGQTVTGDIYVFTSPESGTSKVSFYLDDPTMAGKAIKVESRGPWDFAGTRSDGAANPFPTTTIPDGSHTITAAIALSAGGTEVVTAAFTVANSGPTLFLEPGSLSFAADEGTDPTAQTIELKTSDGVSSAYNLTADAAWLSVSPASGTAPASLTVSVHAADLAPGGYVATMSATASGYATAVATVSLTIGRSGYSLLVSGGSDRSSPVTLDGKVLKGDIYVFTSPESGTSKVSFYLDDPTMAGKAIKVESRGPWDFAGTRSDGAANPFPTTTIPDGSHTITAAIALSAGGTEVVTAAFTVTNSGPALMADPTRASFAVEPGGTASPRTIEVTTSDASAAAYTVADDAAWLAIGPASGTTPATLTLTVDSAGLAEGTYSATVGVSATGYTPAAISVGLSVRNSLAPDQVHLAWVDDPSTTLTVVWRTWDTATPSTVEYRETGAAGWQTAMGSTRPSGTTGTLHEVALTSLRPSTAYEYRVRGDGSAWSEVFTARTAPAPGPADFSAVYVADTGIVGRTDGLTTGTQQVIDEIAALQPTVVLLGGDYAYYNTEDRFASVNDAIDAWFNQMQPIATRSPMMVAYGNHEILLKEGYEHWAARFPTPDGFDGRRFYSFDIGDVHFVSILAVSDTGGLSSSALAWIEQDMQAAKDAGARWIIPFFHVSPLTDGKNHPSNLTLREQLGPLFERRGVKLAISSHDQAYERSYPLVDVPARNTPTSTGKRCYGSSDGVTWLKVSPGGKLSNKNGTFSQFANDPAPSWTAVRDNTMHNFARLLVSSSGTLRVESYGVAGSGAPPVLLDTFEYRLAGCPAELAFGTDQMSFQAAVGDDGATGTVSLAASDASASSFTVSDSAPWLTVSPQTSATPAQLAVAVDPEGLSPGVYTATVTAEAAGYVSDTMTVALTVRDLLVSAGPDRSNPVRLAGRAAGGSIYVFLEPASGASQVRFFLDDPGMAGSPRQVERNPPFDFAGTASDGSARPFDTRRVANGKHTVTVAVDLVGGGTHSFSVDFLVDNAA